jgi:hypothetical protein
MAEREDDRRGTVAKVGLVEDARDIRFHRVASVITS